MVEPTINKTIGAKSTIGSPTRGGEFVVYYDPLDPEAVNTIVKAYKYHCLALGLHMGSLVVNKDNKVIDVKNEVEWHG